MSFFNSFIEMFKSAKNKIWTPPTKEQFDAMTPEQKRVVIATDVIAGLNSRRLNARNGTYVDFNDKVGLDDEGNKDKEVNVVIKDKKCDVCALGAMFISAVDRFDDLKVKNSLAAEDHPTDGFGSAGVYGYLSRFFDYEQLTAMETAFEGRSIGRYVEDPELRERCYAFCKYEGNSEKRMRMVMNNIIDNNGKFIP